MDRVYESGAAAAPPVPPAIPSTGYPSRGNASTGTMPTVPGPYMFHQLVEEIMAVIAAGNIVPDKLVLSQLKLALDAVYVKKNGTSPILQNFPGLTRSLTALGGGLVREYADVANAATVGGLEIGTVYNCAIDPVTGVWAGRDIADICWLEKWTDLAGVKEFWYAPTALVGVVPAWQKVDSLDLVNGIRALTGNLTVSGNASAAAATLAVHAVNLGQFPGTLSGSGYIKIPVIVAGVARVFIIQWSNALSLDQNSTVTATLPVAWPNGLFVAVANKTGISILGITDAALITRANPTNPLTQLDVSIGANGGGSSHALPLSFIAIGW